MFEFLSTNIHIVKTNRILELVLAESVERLFIKSKISIKLHAAERIFKIIDDQLRQLEAVNREKRM